MDTIIPACPLVLVFADSGLLQISSVIFKDKKSYPLITEESLVVLEESLKIIDILITPDHATPTEPEDMSVKVESTIDRSNGAATNESIQPTAEGFPSDNLEKGMELPAATSLPTPWNTENVQQLHIGSQITNHLEEMRKTILNRQSQFDGFQGKIENVVELTKIERGRFKSLKELASDSVGDILILKKQIFDIQSQLKKVHRLKNKRNNCLEHSYDDLSESRLDPITERQRSLFQSRIGGISAEIERLAKIIQKPRLDSKAKILKAAADLYQFNIQVKKAVHVLEKDVTLLDPADGYDPKERSAEKIILPNNGRDNNVYEGGDSIKKLKARRLRGWRAVKDAAAFTSRKTEPPIPSVSEQISPREHKQLLQKSLISPIRKWSSNIVTLDKDSSVPAVGPNGEHPRGLFTSPKEAIQRAISTVPGSTDSSVSATKIDANNQSGIQFAGRKDMQSGIFIQPNVPNGVFSSTTNANFTTSGAVAPGMIDNRNLNSIATARSFESAAALGNASTPSSRTKEPPLSSSAPGVFGKSSTVGPFPNQTTAASALGTNAGQHGLLPATLNVFGNKSEVIPTLKSAPGSNPSTLTKFDHTPNSTSNPFNAKSSTNAIAGQSAAPSVFGTKTSTNTGAGQPPIPAAAPSVFGTKASTNTGAGQPPIPAAAPSVFGTKTSTDSSAGQPPIPAAAPSVFGTKTSTDSSAGQPSYLAAVSNVIGSTPNTSSVSFTTAAPIVFGSASANPLNVAAPSLFGNNTSGGSTVHSTPTSSLFGGSKSLFGSKTSGSPPAGGFGENNDAERAPSSALPLPSLFGSSGNLENLTLSSGQAFGSSESGPSTLKPSKPLFSATPGAFLQKSLATPSTSGLSFGTTASKATVPSFGRTESFGMSTPSSSKGNEPVFGISQGPMIGGSIPFGGISLNDGSTSANNRSNSQTSGNVFGTVFNSSTPTSFGSVATTTPFGQPGSADNKYNSSSFTKPRK